MINLTGISCAMTVHGHCMRQCIGAPMQVAWIRKALDVIQMDSATVRGRWFVVLERTVHEQGQSCIALDDAPPAKREISRTRSSGWPVINLAPLVEVVSKFAARAAKKLRQQTSKAGQIPPSSRRGHFGKTTGSIHARSPRPCAGPLLTPDCSPKARWLDSRRSTDRATSMQRRA